MDSWSGLDEQGFGLHSSGAVALSLSVKLAYGSGVPPPILEPSISRAERTATWRTPIVVEGDTREDLPEVEGEEIGSCKGHRLAERERGVRGANLPS